MSSLIVFCRIILFTLTSATIQQNSTNHEDIGCNYLNLNGIAMPTNHCTLATKYVCNEAWDGITLETYDNMQCDGLPIASQPQQTEDLVGFYCSPEYNESSVCDTISVDAYIDNECEVEDKNKENHVEIRLIMDECLYSQQGEFIQLECNEDGGTIVNIYDTETANCTDENLLNSTDLSLYTLAEISQKYDNECLLIQSIEGCSSSTTTISKEPTKSAVDPDDPTQEAGNPEARKMIGHVTMWIMITAIVGLTMMVVTKYVIEWRLDNKNFELAQAHEIELPEISHHDDSKDIIENYDNYDDELEEEQVAIGIPSRSVPSQQPDKTPTKRKLPISRLILKKRDLLNEIDQIDYGQLIAPMEEEYDV